MNTTQERQCGNKWRHASKADAREHKRKLRKSYGGAFNIYQCAYCGYYHVGHRSKAIMRLVNEQAWQHGLERVEQQRVAGTGAGHSEQAGTRGRSRPAA